MHVLLSEVTEVREISEALQLETQRGDRGRILKPLAGAAHIPDPVQIGHPVRNRGSQFEGIAGLHRAGVEQEPVPFAVTGIEVVGLPDGGRGHEHRLFQRAFHFFLLALLLLGGGLGEDRDVEPEAAREASQGLHLGHVPSAFHLLDRADRQPGGVRKVLLG